MDCLAVARRDVPAFDRSQSINRSVMMSYLIETLISVLQQQVAQYLDRCSLHCMASSHRALRSVLSDPRAYIFNTTYRPRSIEELKNDMKSVDSPLTFTRLSSAFPLHLNSQAARRVYLSYVRSIDLRYCQQGFAAASDVAELLSYANNVIHLNLEGRWTKQLSQCDDLNGYLNSTNCTPLRELLLKLPLQTVYIGGPVWEREARVIEELTDIKSVAISMSAYPIIDTQHFHSFPCLTSATLPERAFKLPSLQHEVWFPALTSLNVRLSEDSIEGLRQLRLTSLQATLPWNGDELVTSLLAPGAVLLSSLTDLAVERIAGSSQIYEFARQLPSLTSLRTEHQHTLDQDGIRSVMRLANEGRLVMLDVSSSSPCDKDNKPFPYEMEQMAPFRGDLKWRFARQTTPVSTRRHAATTLNFLSLPFFSSLTVLDVADVCFDDDVDNDFVCQTPCLKSLHTLRLGEAKARGDDVLRWFSQAAPNVRHLHLRSMTHSHSNLIGTLFPMLRSLELLHVTFSDDKLLRDISQLSLQRLALGDVSLGGKRVTASEIGSVLQSMLLEQDDQAKPSAFRSLCYLLFTANLATSLSDAFSECVEVFVSRPHLQIDFQDGTYDSFLLDHKKCKEWLTT